MAATASLLSEMATAKGIALDEAQIAQLTWLGKELLRWNRRRNLTAITAWDQVVEKHLIDSLLLLPHVPDSGRLLDLGSGAGFPGLPLKIARPALELVSVDAVAKKLFFQRHVARSLGLHGFTAVHGRLEDCREQAAFAEPFDLATARAVADLVSLTAWISPFLRQGGRLLAMKGPGGEAELESCRQRLTADGWQLQVENNQLPLSKANRCLVIMAKSSA